MASLQVDAAIIGGGVGGCAAALAALDRGLTVALTDPTGWLGGQLTSQLVPTDDHLFIEHTGANRRYRDFRTRVRDYYRANFPLADRARRLKHLNPGAGWVSPLSVDPRVVVAVLDALFLPHLSSGRLTVVQPASPVAVDTDQDRIQGVVVETGGDGTRVCIEAKYFVDATEFGDLLALGDIEHVSGREAQSDTGEPGAAETADPLDMQGVTWCFAVDHLDGEDHTIDRPGDYDHWRQAADPMTGDRKFLSLHRGKNGSRSHYFTPGLDDDPYAVDLDHRHMGAAPEMWNYRRIAARKLFEPGFYRSDIVVINWPQNDYVGGPLFGVPDSPKHWEGAKSLSRSLLYWLQTEAPRPDGGTGWPGLRLRGDVAGTADGFAMHPYVRESRRIKALRTIVEQDVSGAVLGEDAPAKAYADSVGVGHYFWVDRHPSTKGNRWPAALPQPFQIPLSGLIPQRVQNLLPAAKNIGTTQITNGCYRLHPVEWSVGEAVGELIAYCLANKQTPHGVAQNSTRTAAFQDHLTQAGFQLSWDGDLRWNRKLEYGAEVMSRLAAGDPLS